ncbi:hypothetical protein PXC01_09875 [Maribacter sp. M208]|uniref:hypothetical protein n=1 Tax=Maribacter huludaoensis TaxID=3030010 RepID=UPI0023ED7906|nr:hypothetical protein [Maribacter huludaoensis]MDF4221891.1 hypothetical protein [Maribacter huludaoensis]
MTSSKFINIVLKAVRSFWVIVLIGFFGIIIAIGVLFNQVNEDNEFGSYKIPENLAHMKKTMEGFSKTEMDSLKLLKPETEKLIITGTGYGGYTFYYWHKSKQPGNLYIRGFESQREVELMEKELPKRTRKTVVSADGNYHLYTSETAIHEGTFEKFYPARFELWFESENGKEKEKLTEIEYLIDGWDR